MDVARRVIRATRRLIFTRNTNERRETFARNPNAGGHVLTRRFSSRSRAAYIDIPGLQKYVDHFALMSYDSHTPEREPDVANYVSPMISNQSNWRIVDALVNAVDGQKADTRKLVLGISTFGRTLKMSKDNDSVVPPVDTVGPGEPGTYTKTDGLLAYYEICPYLVENSEAPSNHMAYRYKSVDCIIVRVNVRILSRL